MRSRFGFDVFDIDQQAASLYLDGQMSTTAPSVKRKYSKTSLEAGDRLLKAVKAKLLKDKGKIDYDALRRGGYSDDLIARLREV